MPPADAPSEPSVHHESARKRRGPKPASMQLNLTSMIDVIFQLLIYFVVTASFTQDEGVLAAKMPQREGSSQDDIPPQELVIQIQAAGTDYVLSIEGDPSTVRHFNDLRQRLEAMRFDPSTGTGSIKADDPVKIRPEGRVRWQHVVNAFNTAVAAEYTDVGFAAPASAEAGGG